MTNIIQLLQGLPDFYSLTGASEQSIHDAEKNLGLAFSPEYREYVAAFGVASANGHELTGVCKPTRLNVVNVTLAEREVHTNVSTDWYVIEQANIDGIVIWQAPSGEIYQTMPNALPRQICSSLSEYISG